MDHWNENHNCGLVVGATHPNHLLQVRNVIGENGVLLVPGIGAQGGDLKTTIQYGLNRKKEGMIINVSRTVLYASLGTDYAKAARAEVERLNAEILEYIELPNIRWESVRPAVYQQRTLEILQKMGAVLRNDHFVYQAGEHGPVYIAKDKVSPDPIALDEIGRMMADLLYDENIDTVVAPALGAIALGHIVAKYLSYKKGSTVHCVYLEKGDLGFRVTRGFEEYLSEKRVVVVEDITNTGDSAYKVAAAATRAGAHVTKVAVICNRGNVQADNVFPLAELINLSSVKLVKYKEEDCPLCKEGVPINTVFGHGKEFVARQLEKQTQEA